MPAIRPRSRLGIVLAALSVLALAVAGPADAHDGGKGANVYKKRNLVSDIDGVARITDPNLVNPWGLAFGPATPASRRSAAFNPSSSATPSTRSTTCRLCVPVYASSASTTSPSRKAVPR